MKVFDELNFDDVKRTAWGQAERIAQEIEDADKESEFETLIEELYPDGIDRTELNDLMAYDWEWLFETLGIKDEKEQEDEE